MFFYGNENFNRKAVIRYCKKRFFHFFKQTGSIQLNEAIYIEPMWDSVTSGKDVAWGVIVH